MILTFSKIIPVPIPEQDILNSEIWNRDLTLNSSINYLIHADSGKGKTTFVNIITGNRKDYSGKLLIDNKNIKDFSDKEISKLRKEKISIVPQGLALFDNLSLIDNILIKNKIQNFKTDTEISEMLELLGLKTFENKTVEKLSFGQKQRLAIIRSLCQSFEIILLDEPFSHLDKNNATIAWNLIKNEAQKQNAGIVITSLQNNFQDNLIKLKI